MDLASYAVPIGVVASVYDVPLTVTTDLPAIACSSNVPRLLLVEPPQLPACSPVLISSRPRRGEYDEGILGCSQNCRSRIRQGHLKEKVAAANNSVRAKVKHRYSAVCFS